jgi:phosphohistidine phosphatase
MRQLLLFRHAEAEPPRSVDRERPLTAAGRQAAARVGAYLAETKTRIDLALISDAVRARETWEAAALAFGAKPHARVVGRLYQAARRDVMDLAREAPDSARNVLILAHNPALGEFAAQFAGSGDPEALARILRGFPPAGLAMFDVETDEWRQLRWHSGALERFLT